MQFDVLVLGGGLSGGLPAATYLQKAGFNVGLLEQSHECGQFFSSYRRRGVLFDHSPVNFSCMSPAVADLDLERFGYETRPPERLFSTVDGQDRVFAYHGELERTVRSLSRHSSTDARTFREILNRLDDVSDELLNAAIFTPEPDQSRTYSMSANVLQLEPEKLRQLSGVELMERLFRSEAVRMSLAALPSLQLFGDMASTNHGAVTWLLTFLLRSCVSPDGNGQLVDSLVEAFHHYGGDLYTETTVEQIDGDSVVAGGRRFKAPIILSNLGPSLTYELMDQPLERPWSTGMRTVLTADLVLGEPLQWNNESCSKAPRVYLIWESWDEYRDWVTRFDLETFLGHLELTQFHNIYGSNKQGEVGLRVRFGSGPWIDEDWADRISTLQSALMKRLQRIDPGIGDRLTDLTIDTPRDHWQTNPAAIHGNPVGGDFIDGQWMGERFGYRDPGCGLYLSNGVWPPALSWMAAGFNAATAIMEDSGRTFPEWWTRPQ